MNSVTVGKFETYNVVLHAVLNLWYDVTEKYRYIWSLVKKEREEKEEISLSVRETRNRIIEYFSSQNSKLGNSYLKLVKRGKTNITELV